MIRRIMTRDLRDLENLQKYGIQYERYYPRHAAWLKKALHEIERGRRRAYGYFGSISGSEKDELLGAIMLRVSSADIIEVKNLVVRDKENTKRPQTHAGFIGEDLISRVVEASSRRGFSRLETELPADAEDQIQWFLSQGFQVQSSRESSAAHIPFYLLRKDVMPCYRGDPFDTRSMARWLLTKRLGWKFVREEAVKKGRRTICYRLRFVVSDSPKNDSLKEEITQENTRLFQITGDCFVDNGASSQTDLTDMFQKEAGLSQGDRNSQTSADLRFFASPRLPPVNERFFDRYGVRAVVGKRLLREIGFWSFDNAIDVVRDSVTGVIVQLGAAFEKAFKERCSENTDTTFEYIVTNGIGDVLARNLEDGNGPFVAIFCTEETESGGSPLIIGIAAIKEVRARLAIEVSRSPLYNGLADAEFIFDEFTANFNAQGLVWRFTLDSPREVPSRVLLTDCVSKSIMPFVKQSSGELLPCYADRNTVEAVLQKIQFNARGIEALSFTPKPSTSKPIYDSLIEVMVDVLVIIENQPWLQEIAGNLASDDIRRRKDDLRYPLPEKQRGRRGKGIRRPDNDLFDLSSAPDIPPATKMLLEETLKLVENWTKLKNLPSAATIGELNEEGRLASIKAERLLEATFDFLVTRTESLNSPLRGIAIWLKSIATHKRRFTVSLSFRGEEFRIPVIRPVANLLAEKITKDQVMFDEFHQAAVSRPFAIDYIRTLYFNESELIVVFLTPGYYDGTWTSQEWAQIRRLISLQSADRIMLIMLEKIDMDRLGLDPDRDIGLNAIGMQPEDITSEISKRIKGTAGAARPE